MEGKGPGGGAPAGRERSLMKNGLLRNILSEETKQLAAKNRLVGEKQLAERKQTHSARKKQPAGLDSYCCEVGSWESISWLFCEFAGKGTGFTGILCLS